MRQSFFPLNSPWCNRHGWLDVETQFPFSPFPLPPSRFMSPSPPYRYMSAPFPPPPPPSCLLHVSGRLCCFFIPSLCPCFISKSKPWLYIYIYIIVPSLCMVSDSVDLGFRCFKWQERMLYGCLSCRPFAGKPFSKMSLTPSGSAWSCHTFVKIPFEKWSFSNRRCGPFEIHVALKNGLCRIQVNVRSGRFLSRIQVNVRSGLSRIQVNARSGLSPIQVNFESGLFPKQITLKSDLFRTRVRLI